MEMILPLDVLEDINRSLRRRNLQLNDFEIEVIDQLTSEGHPIFGEGKRFRITHKPTGDFGEYAEGHGHDIRDTLCKDILEGRFPRGPR